MSSRSLNKVQLIGNLTRDVELRYTPQGTPVATIGLATNRSWTDSSGQRQEETEFHRLVAWNKLAELCSQLLFKGRKVFVEGRLQTRKWTGQDGQERQTTEIVIDDMIVLDNRRRDDGAGDMQANMSQNYNQSQDMQTEETNTKSENNETEEVKKEEEKDSNKDSKEEKEKKEVSVKETEKKDEKKEDEEVDADDIPF